MIDQASIIDHITEQFFENIRRLSDKNNDKNKEEISFFIENINCNKGELVKEGIYVNFLGLEPVYLNNQFERVQKKEINKDGKEIEFLAQPALQFKCTYMIRPYFERQSNVAKMLGLIIRHLRDSNSLDAGDFDWVGNNSLPVVISLKSDANLSEQMRIFNQLGVKYTPALFYDVVVGIDSNYREEFTRVKERKIDAGLIDRKK